jgi:hypothetical protein
VQDFSYGTEPGVAVFADGEAARSRLARSVTQAGASVAISGTIADAAALLDERPVDSVLVDAVDSHPALAALLDRLEGDAQAARMGSVVAIPPTLIDLAMAHAPHGDVVLLCDGSDLETVAALSLALALAERNTLLFEERNDDLSGQLRRVREEVGRIARALATVAGGEERTPVLPALPEPLMVPGDEPGTTLLRRMIRVRRMRDHFFEPDLFADPAWDMLLDLMLARMEGRPVAVSSLCIAAAVPPTTALRWIKRLVDDGLFVRHADPLDGRRVFIDLSEAGALAMMRYLRASVAAERAAG